MDVTELLVTGYHGNQPVFVVNLAPDEATTVLTNTDQDGTATVDSATKQTTPAFASICTLLEALTVAPERGRSGYSTRT